MHRQLVRLLVVAVAAVVAGSLSTAPAGAVKAGAAGPATRAHHQLSSLGCSAGPVTGAVAPRLRAAVIRFQAANGLAQDGRLGRRTRARLYAESPVRCDDRPVVTSGQGRRVVISQRQNYVWLVRADGTVAGEGPMVDNPAVLRPGSFRVGSHCGRAAKIRRNSDYSGAFWLPFFTRFAPCGVGFHQVPLHKTDGTQLHPDWLLGTDLRRSHGCIRMSRELVARVWTFAGPGTRVVVTGRS